MPQADPDVQRLLQIFRLERDLLVTGRLDQLTKIEAAKARLLSHLTSGATRPDPSTLRRLRAAARANQRLYEAALQGIGRVRDQVAQLLTGGGAELSTYAPDGGRRALLPRRNSLERRS